MFHGLDSSDSATDFRMESPLSSQGGSISCVPARRGQMTKQERDRQIVERVHVGENRVDVAAEFGLSESTVTNICYAGEITGRQERQA